jgi:predicted AAA+ superfamily ATPase
MKHKKVKTLVSNFIKKEIVPLSPVQETPNSVNKFIGFLSNKTNNALTIDEINDATQKAWSKSE